MKKRLLSLIFVTLLTISFLAMSNIHTAFAAHEAKVYWVGHGRIVDPTTMAFKQITYDEPIEVIFAVNNTGVVYDKIVGVEVIIPQDETGKALFRLVGGQVAAPGWVTDIVEVDARGWVRIWRFYTPEHGQGIDPPMAPVNFSLIFDAGPERCRYNFTIWTDDAGLTPPKQKHSHTLTLIIDDTPPTATILHPQSMDPPLNVTAVKVNVTHHCMWINVTAQDLEPHNTNIWNWSISIDGILWKNGTYEPPIPIWDFAEKYYNLARGYHNVTVEVWDGVGNKGVATSRFYYFVIFPEIHITDPITREVTSAPTTIVEGGLVKGVQYTYGAKTLGTTVTITGINFNANSSVNVTVSAPYGELLVAKPVANADGRFATSFVFPTAPAGIYVITATDEIGMFAKNQTIVVPEIIYKPETVVGPALIEVIATGFTAQNTTRGSWFFIVPDALNGINIHTQWGWWYIDGNGTLQNNLNEHGKDCEPPQIVGTTLNWPYLEPGNYTVEIKHVNGDYWDGTTGTWIHKPCFAGSNIIIVTNWISDVLNAAEGAEAAAQDAKTSADAAKTSADAAKTSADAAKTSADAAKTSADAAKTSADAAKTSADAAKTSADAATSSANTAGTNANAAKASADAAKAAAEGTEAAAESAQAAAEGLTMPVYLAVILSLIAAIAAAICTFLVYRKIA